MAIWINNELCNKVEEFVTSNWPDKKVRSRCRPRSWNSSRYIQVSTPLNDEDMDLHYELKEGRVQLHFEGKFLSEEYKSFLDHLRSHIKSDGHFQWRRWMGMNQGLCEINAAVETWDDVFARFTEIINTFDPIIRQYIGTNQANENKEQSVEFIPPLSYELGDSSCRIPQTEVKAIGQIEFDKLSIPPYQRPYKWTAKNVNQLISDILTFRNKSNYRLGTLVLHNGEIVDGQQRIITLTLLIKRMYEVLNDDQKKAAYKDFIARMNTFACKTQFPNRYSLHNIVENIHVIDTRESDFDDELFDFIMRKCEFVVIELGDISEAFQFFDSQNARGLDLGPHDLLKAFHLREIEKLSDEDSRNIDDWQLQDTNFLKEVFLTLYRAKRWSQGNTARYFTKNDTDAFKGVSLNDRKRYPFYQMEVIAHIFTELYSRDSLRFIDQNKMEYPFNLDDQIVNGSRFFDMIRHYMSLYRKVRNIKSPTKGSMAAKILDCINEYEGMSRSGDKYVRSMFDTLLLYYIDRFGNEELNKVIPKFFIWAYSLRLKNQAVQLASIDKYAIQNDSMLRHVHNAKTPYDIINLSQEGLEQGEIVGTKCDKIKEIFDELKKVYNNA